MSLKEYVAKREFKKTPEPKGGPVQKKASGECHFYIQRHDATRLHYDFRLEMDGVLKSWAVPKGPSLEPLSKHLAMHVEDHPLEYGTFEGNIPKGEYGGGSVMLWDRGTFELLGDTTGDKQIERGDLKFRLNGEKLKGEFALIHMRSRGKGNEWLIIKKKDAEAKSGWNIEDHARSVLTGRTQQEIADNLPAIKSAAELKNAKGRVAVGVKKKSVKRSAEAPPRLPEGAVKADMPVSMGPMTATLVDQPPVGDEWLYEVKWDGVRGLCFIQNGQVRILSRTGNRCDQQYPELSVLPHYVHGDTAILDGEIAVLDANGRPTFSMIQPRIAVADPNSIAHLSRKTPVTLFVFDLLYLNGYDLRQCALIDRKKLLGEVIEGTEHIRLSGHFLANGKEMLEAARQSGLEGIVAKRLDSKYESRRSREWLKIKVVNDQEFVIGGFTHGERAFFSSLVLGLYEAGKLIHAGQVGTGFNDRSLQEIYKKLEPLITDKSPFANKPNRVLRKMTWVRPEMVAQIKYLEFTNDGILRAPVFLGLRNDKNPKECIREVPARTAEEVPEVTAGRPEPPAQQKFSNLTKIFFPKDAVTKGDVIQYYDEVAEFILPHLKDRPLSLKRYPNGIHAQYFFQKNVADAKFPQWVRTEPIPSESQDHIINYVIANDKPTLLYLANLGCIDQNPWMSRIGSLDNPDFVLIDLDPYECSYDQIVEAALITRKALDEIGLEGYPKTTGGDGMHIYVPVEPVYTYEQVRSFAEVLWHLVIARQPDLFTTPRSVAHRKKGRVYFDYLQIGKSKTIAAPYVLRAHDGAPVATPLAWKEVKKGLTPDKFTIRNAVARFRRVGDVFGGVLTNKQRLEAPIQRLSELLRKGS